MVFAPSESCHMFLIGFCSLVWVYKSENDKTFVCSSIKSLFTYLGTVNQFWSSLRILETTMPSDYWRNTGTRFVHSMTTYKVDYFHVTIQQRFFLVAGSLQLFIFIITCKKVDKPSWCSVLECKAPLNNLVVRFRLPTSPDCVYQLIASSYNKWICSPIKQW